MKQHYKLFLIAIVVITNFIYVNGQPIISGKVINDSSNTGISFANIFITVIDNPNKIVAFTASDSTGHFFITINDNGRFLLKVSHIGYEKKELIINMPGNETPNQKKYLEIRLKEAAIELNDVKVSSLKIFDVRGDTINVSVQALGNKNDKVVEDILKRIPGVEVDEKGKVYVNGKEVKKIKIEDDDLFQQNYQILTQNINSNIIKTVQIVNRYLDEPLLKGIKQSDDVAINLVLKDSIKAKIFGGIDGGYGINNKYEVRGNAISILPKNKLYFIGTSNNIGENVGTDNITSNNDETNSNDENKSFILPNNKTDIASSYISAIDRKRYQFGNKSLYSLSWICKPAKQWNIKNTTFLSVINTPFSYNSETTYFLDTSYTNIEKVISNPKDIRFNSRFDVTYNINNNKKIENVLQFSRPYELLNGSKFLNNQGSIGELVSKQYNIDYHIFYLSRISDKSANTFFADYKRYNNQQNFSVIPSQLQPFFQGYSFDSVHQSYHVNVTYFDAGWKYIINSKIANIEFNNIISSQDNDFNSNLNIGANALPTFLPIINKQSINNKEANSNIAMTKKMGSFSFSLNGGINYQNITISDTLSNKFLFANVGGTLKVKIDNMQNLIALYSSSSNIKNINELYNNVILTDYNSFSSGIENPVRINSSLYLINYQLGKWSNSFLANLIMIYQRFDKNISKNSFIYPNYITAKDTITPQSNYYNISLSIDKYFKILSGNFKFKYSNYYNEYYYFIYNNAMKMENSTNKIDISYRSAFNFPININIGSTLSYNNAHPRSIKNIKQTKLFSAFSDLYIKFNDGLNGVINIQNINLKQGSIKNNITFVEASFNQKLSKKISLYISASNLLNQRSYFERTITETQTNDTKYSLLGRVILMGINIKL